MHCLATCLLQTLAAHNSKQQGSRQARTGPSGNRQPICSVAVAMTAAEWTQIAVIAHQVQEVIPLHPSDACQGIDHSCQGVVSQFWHLASALVAYAALGLPAYGEHIQGCLCLHCCSVVQHRLAAASVWTCPTQLALVERTPCTANNRGLLRSPVGKPTATAGV